MMLRPLGALLGLLQLLRASSPTWCQAVAATASWHDLWCVQP